jgi:hypothetical protein
MEALSGANGTTPEMFAECQLTVGAAKANDVPILGAVQEGCVLSVK